MTPRAPLLVTTLLAASAAAATNAAGQAPLTRPDI